MRSSNAGMQAMVENALIAVAVYLAKHEQHE
jgi:hypothetical protein